MNQKLLLVSGAILALVISLVPFNTTLVPEWQLRVVNETGVPYAGKGVRQFCYSYTLGVSPCHDSNDFMRETDASGYVVFPERKIHASLLSRILRTIYNFVMIIADGSFGESVYVDATGPNGYERLEYLHGRPAPEIFVLPSTR